MKLRTALAVASLLVFVVPDVKATRTASDYKGLKQGFYMTYLDDDQVTVTVGKLHNTTSSSVDKILELTSNLDSNALTLSGTQWYYVYIETPASGVTPTASGIKCLSNKIPTFVDSKLGWYNPDESDERCIGALWIKSGVIQPFIQTAERFQLSDEDGPIAFSGSITSNDQSTPQEVTLDAPDFARNSAVIAMHLLAKTSDTGGRLNVRRGGTSNTAGIRLANMNTQNMRWRVSIPFDVPISSSEKAEYWLTVISPTSAGLDVDINVIGYVMPFGLGESNG